MTAAERRRLMLLAEWSDREWAIFTMGFEAGVEESSRAIHTASAAVASRARVARRAAAALHEHPSSIREAIERVLAAETP